MIFGLKDRLREFALKKAKSNIIITQLTSINGKLVHKKIGDSLVGNFMAAFVNDFIPGTNGSTYWRTSPVSANYGTMININGNDQTGVNSHSIVAPSGNSTYGILLGNSPSPSPTILDYDASNVLSNGTGANQLNYASTGYVYKGISGNSFTIGISRAATNESGATIGVTEVYAVCYVTTSLTSNILMYHDIESQSVPSGATITVELDFTITT